MDISKKRRLCADKTCDKLYDNKFNEYYGAGLANAYTALIEEKKTG
ncbi:hypothetical protein KQI45_05350 [Clostridium sporogenes]|nr:hypothetical protein [Clostridium sporogenes]MBU5299501.1 hypothetical protein [Clostridium sporogenes]